MKMSWELKKVSETSVVFVLGWQRMDSDLCGMGNKDKIEAR